MERRVNPHSFTTWFGPTKQESSQNGTIVVRVPSRPFRKRLTETYGELLQKTLAELGAPDTRLEFLCEEDGAAPAQPMVSSTPKEAQKAEKCPQLSEQAWYGLSRKYREIQGPRTEASHNYHLACFLSAVGVCLGRSVYIKHAGRHYPNLFVVLVGKSGGARKGTALNFGSDLVQALDPKIGIVDSLDSREGFLEHLAELGKQQEDRGGVSAVIHIGELRSLIEKTRMEGLGNIVPMLCDAYDCRPALAVHTRKNPITVPHPAVSLAAATSPRWIEGLQEQDLEGGLGNRIMWVPGEPGRPIPKPPDVDGRHWATLVRDLRKRIARWPQKQGAMFSLSPATEERWVTIYTEIFGHHDDDPLIEILGQRLQNHCLKVALIWAALDGSTTIELHHLEAAYSFTQFLYDSLWYLFRGHGASPMAQLDAKIIEAVRRAGPKGVRLPKLKHMFWRHGMELLNRRLLHLTVTDGPIVRMTDGHKVILIAADSESE